MGVTVLLFYVLILNFAFEPVINVLVYIALVQLVENFVAVVFPEFECNIVNAAPLILGVQFFTLDSQSQFVLAGANGLLYGSRVNFIKRGFTVWLPLDLQVFVAMVLPSSAAADGIQPVPIIIAPKTSLLYFVRYCLRQNEPIL